MAAHNIIKVPKTCSLKDFYELLKVINFKEEIFRNSIFSLDNSIKDENKDHICQTCNNEIIPN